MSCLNRHTLLFITAMVKTTILTALAICGLCCRAQETAGIVSMPTAGVWPDSDGNHINAHGGNVIFHDGAYYWYGEQRPERGFTVDAGVSCYRSDDMLNWENVGTVMTVSQTPGDDIESGCIIERPKVVYNEKTGKFVMWFHLELKGKGYEAARAGVAVADTPDGPFTFVGSGRINPGKLPLNLDSGVSDSVFNYDQEWWTPAWREDISRGMFTLRDKDGGQMSRDMTIFVDDDGKAYHIYSSEDNLTLQIAELDDSYTSHTGKYIRIFPGGHNEAPAMFKHDGVYWMIASGCTGWEPNEARLMKADDIMGEWEMLPNPCRGKNAEKTFGGQSNYVFREPGENGRYIAMFDVWNPKSLANSRYIWLPIEFGDDGVPRIEYRSEFR